jgi:vancomycin aglycone glucosyltransferase
MKALLTTVGSRGDLQPFVGLAIGLRQAGHEVTVAAPPNFRGWLEELGFSFHPVGIDFYELSQSKPDLASSPIRAFRVMTSLLRDEVATQFRDTQDIVDGMDVVLAGGLQIAAASCAERARVPYIYTAFAPGLLRSSNQLPPLLPAGRLPRWLNDATWSAFEGIFQRLLGPGVNRERQRLGLAPHPRFGALLIGSQPLLACDPFLSITPRDTEVPVVETGAWTYEPSDSLPDEVERFLAAGTAPHYLGFGSIPDASPEETTRQFVEAVRSVGGRGLISRGWANLAAEPLPESFLAVGSLPHHRLFARVATVIHHGGAGTTQTAARAGVPQILIPHGADQFYWASRVREVGVGPAGIPRTRFSAKRLAAALNAISGDACYRQRALALGERLRAVDGVGNAVRHLEARYGAMKQRASA